MVLFCAWCCVVLVRCVLVLGDVVLVSRALDSSCFAVPFQNPSQISGADDGSYGKFLSRFVVSYVGVWFELLSCINFVPSSRVLFCIVLSFDIECMQSSIECES